MNEYDIKQFVTYTSIICVYILSYRYKTIVIITLYLMTRAITTNSFYSLYSRSWKTKT